jgi:hypothetical protein
MSFFQRLFSIFVSPHRVFDDIRESRVSWWQPWIIVSMVYVVATWLMAPLQQAMLEANPQFQGQGAGDQMGLMRTVGIVMAPAMALVVTALAAGITYVLVTLTSKEATFKKYFTLLFFANVVFAVGYLLTTVLLRLRGIENVTSPEDMQVSLSLRVLAPEGSSLLKGLLGSIEFFSIWGLVLVVVGLRRVFAMRTGQAIGCVIPLWVIFAAFSVLGEVFMNFNR